MKCRDSFLAAVGENCIRAQPPVNPQASGSGQIGARQRRIHQSLLAALCAMVLLSTWARAAVTNIAWYRFGESDPGATIGAAAALTKDSAGLRDITMIGGPLYSSDVAPAAALHAGSSSSLRFSSGQWGTNATVSTAVNNFGLELWVKPAGVTGGHILAYNGHTGTSGWGLLQDTANLSVLFGGKTVFGSVPVVTNAWTHLALVRDNGTTTLYANGVATATSVVLPNVPAGSFGLGAPPQTPTTDFFAGGLDEVRVFTFSPGGFSTNDLLLNRPATGVTVTTLPASGVTTSSATLNGVVNPNGADCMVFFQYGITASYGSVSAPSFVSAATVPVPVASTLQLDQPNTLFHVRAVASNSLGTTYGNDLTFTTPLVPPVIQPGVAVTALAISATVLAQVEPFNSPGKLYVRYGTVGRAQGYGFISVTNDIAGVGPVLVQVPLAGLQPNTIYYYGITAFNSAGASSVEDLTFTSGPLPPSVSSPSATDLAGRSMTLRAMVNPNSAFTQVHIEYQPVGDSNVYFSATNTLPAGSAEVAAAVTLEQLLPNTCYDWRVVAANNGGASVTPFQRSCTSPLAPTASSLPVSAKTPRAATLNGRANPNGASTSAHFEYGLTPAMTNSTATAALGNGASEISFSRALTNLAPNTLYFYRAVAVNGSGTAYGSPIAFTTPQPPSPPLVTPPSNSLAITMAPTRQAKARGYNRAGVLSAVYVLDGGAGYTSPPRVVVTNTSGSGAGGTVTAAVAGGAVSSLTIQNPGAYSELAEFSVLIDPPPNPLEQALTNSSAAILLLPFGTIDANTVIARDVTLRGQGIDATIITGGGRGSVFRVLPGVHVVFEDLTIRDGAAENGGGILNDQGAVEVNRCSITYNQATGTGGEGGGIYNRGPATCTVNDSVICNNTSKRNGAGISNSGVNTAVVPGLDHSLNYTAVALQSLRALGQDPQAFGVKVVNTAKGAIYSLPDLPQQIASQIDPTKVPEAFSAAVQFLKRRLDGKFKTGVAILAGGDGTGAILSNFSDPYGPKWVEIGGAMLILNRSLICDNTSDAEVAAFGGGLHNDVGLVLLTDTELSGNRAQSNLGAFGGAVNNLLGAIRMVRCSLHDNVAVATTVVSSGGAVFSASGLFDAQDCDFSSNTSSAKLLSAGGAIQNTAGGRATLTRCRLNLNDAGTSGGAVENDYLARLTATNCVFSQNRVTPLLLGNGGGLANQKGGLMTLVGCTVNNNSVTGWANGGGIYNHCEFVEWSKDIDYGQLQGEIHIPLITNSTLTLVNCTISSNTAAGRDFLIPEPADLVLCIAQNQVVPGSCNFADLRSTPIPLPAQGGGIFNGSQADAYYDLPQNAIFPGEAVLNLSSCTIVGNAATGRDLLADIFTTAGGGIYDTDSSDQPRAPTSKTRVNIGNTLVALNTLNQAPSDFDDADSVFPVNTTVINSFAPNLDTDGQLAAHKTTGSGPVFTAAEPRLGPLANNGGATRTHALLSGSPALNSGSGSAPAFDQRGVARPQNGQADIGAFEAAAPQLLPDAFSTLQDNVLNAPSAAGVLTNDIGVGLAAQLGQPPLHGAVVLAQDGGFTYTPATNYAGTDSFTYTALDSAGLPGGPALVSLTIRPVLRLVSNAPPANSITGPRDHLSLTFDRPVAPGALPTSILVRGAQSAGQPVQAIAAGNVVSISVSNSFHPGELVTVELLRSLVDNNGAVFPESRTFQYVTQVGAGSGQFTTATDLPAGGGVAVALADLDGNGSLDAYVAGDLSDEVWLNDGRGSFTRVQLLPGNSTGVALGDLNGDGFPDAVVTKAGGVSGFLYPISSPIFVDAFYPRDYNRIYFNDGTGHFTASPQGLVPDVFIDPDTRPDPAWFPSFLVENVAYVIVTSPSGIRYFYNPRDWSISQFDQYLNEGSSGAAIGDLNGDGYLDILLINDTSKTFFDHRVRTPGNTVWLNNGHGAFRRAGAAFSTAGARAVGLADLDGNGTLDAAIATDQGTEIWLNDGSGGFTHGGTHRVASNEDLALAVGDVNGDGFPDVISSTGRPWYETQGPLFGNQVWLNDGRAGFSPGRFFVTVQSRGLALADLNADGRLDVIVTGIFGNAVWFNTGNDFVPAGPVFGGDRSIGDSVATGDLDGDGDLDAFVVHQNDFHKIWFNDSRPTVNTLDFTVGEEGVLVVPPPGVFAGGNDLDGPLQILETNVVRIYTANTVGLLLGIVHGFPDFDSHAFGYDDQGHAIYRRVVPVYAQNGSLNLRPDGSFTYTPSPFFDGADGFQFVVSDGFLTATGTVNITVTPIFRPILARNDYYPLAGGPLNVSAANGVLANDESLNGAPLTAAMLQGPAHGAATLNPNGSFLYTPGAGYSGPDAFSYRANDGQTNAIARVKLGNSMPVAVFDYYPMTADGRLLVDSAHGVLANDVDADGEPLTATLSVPPAHGQVTLNPDGSFAYTRAATYSGNDRFTYLAGDGVAFSAETVVRLGSAVPIANNDGPYTVIENQPALVPAGRGVLTNDVHPDGYAMQAALVAGPVHGSLSFEPDGAFTYTPQQGFVGDDAFSYRVNDGVSTSAVAQVTLSVSASTLQIAGVSPRAIARTSTAITITFSSRVPSSLAGASVLLSGSMSGVHAWSGTASNNQATIVPLTPFLPGETVHVTVAPGWQSFNNVALGAGYAWTFRVATRRGAGVLPTSTPLDVVPFQATGGTVADLNGDGWPDALAFDGSTTAGKLLLYINNGGRTFTRQDTNPPAVYYSVLVGDFDEDGRMDLFVRRDPYPEGLRSEVWRNNGNGTFAIQGAPGLPYQAPDYVEIYMDIGDVNRDGHLDLIGYAVTEASFNNLDQDGVIWTLLGDGAGHFAPGPFTLTHAPGEVSVGAIGDVNADGSLDLWLAGINGLQLWTNSGAGQFTQDIRVAPHGEGNVALALGDMNGDGSLDAVVVDLLAGLTVYFNDGKGGFSPSIQHVPLPLDPEDLGLHPLALGDLGGNGRLDVVVGCADGRNRVLLNDGTGHFSPSVLGSEVIYTTSLALADFDRDGAVDVFTANHSTDLPSAASKIWWNRLPPAANDDFYPAGTLQVQARGVLTNDLAGDGGPISAVLVSQPTNATVVLAADGSFSLTPGTGFAGVTRFTYRAIDASSSSPAALVKIGNSRPAAGNDGPFVVYNDLPLAVDAAGGVLTNDSDTDADPLTLVLAGSVAHGTLRVYPDGSFAYSANPGYTGSDSFSYYVTDGFTNSNVATVTLNVRARLHLVKTSPSANDLSVPLQPALTARFDQAIDPGTLAGQIFVTGSLSGRNSVVAAVTGDTITITPAGFKPGETVTVAIGAGVRSVGGEPLSAPVLWQFTTDASLGRGVFADTGQRLIPSNSSNGVLVAVGDVNGDGRLDAVLSSGPAFTNFQVVPGSAATTVWLNDGQGRLTDSGQRLDPGTTFFPRSIAMADVNGDGRPDFSLSRFGYPVELWLNDGTGHFNLAPNQPPAANCAQITFADVDGNGSPDLVCLQLSGNILVLTNDKAGRFIDSGQRLLNGTGPSAFAVGDLDQDGALDLVESYSGNSAQLGSVRILLNDGHGRFRDGGRAIATAENNVSHLALADLNGDGALDLAVRTSRATLSGVEIWLNDRLGSFTNSGQNILAPSLQHFQLADLDGNGSLDLVAESPSTGAFVYFNNGAGIMTGAGVQLAGAIAKPTDAAIADLNGDGAPDLFLVASSGPSLVLTNGANFGGISGESALTIGDNALAPPFTSFELEGLATSTVLLSVRLDLAKGTFTPASLAAAGFTGPVNSTFSRVGSNPGAAQAALRQLVFAPVANRRPVGETETSLFTVVLSNGSASRTNTAATVTALSLNDPPVAGNDSGAGFATTEAAALTTASVFSNDTDPDPGDASGFTVASLDTSGTIGAVTNLGNGSFRYDPSGRFATLPTGAATNDVFYYFLSDRHGGRSTGRVSVAISGLNSAPLAGADAISVGEHSGATDLTPQLLLNDSDPDAGETATLVISVVNTAGTVGTVTLATGRVSYNAGAAFASLAEGATATDHFAYTIRDTHGATATAPVTVTVLGQNDAPLPLADGLSLRADSATTNLTLFLLSNDSDPDAGESATLAIAGVDDSFTKGIVRLTNGVLTYLPGAEFASLPLGSNAIDRFDYVVQDTRGASAKATVTITNLGVNRAPSALADAFAVLQGAPATNVTAWLLANDSDANSAETDALRISALLTNGTTGGLRLTNGSVIYSPPSLPRLGSGQSLNDAFSYIISDIHGATSTGSVRVVVSGQSLPPTALPDVVVIWTSANFTDITSTLLANDTAGSPGGVASLTITALYTSGTRGLVQLYNGAVWYQARGRFDNLAPGQTVSDSFTYEVSDSSGATAVTSVNVTVAGAPIIARGDRQPAGPFHLRILGLTGRPCAVLASTDLVHWGPIGAAMETAPGVFEFDDPDASVYPVRFYLIRQ